MGHKKVQTTQNQTQANTFDYKLPPITPQIQALQSMKATADPAIPYNYAGQKADLENSYNNPIGSYTTPAVREALQRSAGRQLAMNEGQATQESQYNADNANYARQAGIASMTAPQLVQTGGTSTGTGTQTTSGGFLQDLAMGIVGGVGSAAANPMGFA